MRPSLSAPRRLHLFYDLPEPLPITHQVPILTFGNDTRLPSGRSVWIFLHNERSGSLAPRSAGLKPSSLCSEIYRRLTYNYAVFGNREPDEQPFRPYAYFGPCHTRGSTKHKCKGLLALPIVGVID